MKTSSFVSRGVVEGAATTQESDTRTGGEIDVEMLKDIWKKTLRVESVSDDDNLFVVGGSSLQAMFLASHIEQLSATLDLVAFLENPTFHGLCANITPQE